MQTNTRFFSKVRPTAVNLATATQRMLGCPSFEEVQRIAEEERVASENMAMLGASLVVRADGEEGPVRVITHCNTGSLCTYGLGTALGCIVKKHMLDGAGSVFVYVDVSWYTFICFF
jgi:methylthioribose-1-phosphate isomerase